MKPVSKAEDRVREILILVDDTLIRFNLIPNWEATVEEFLIGLIASVWAIGLFNNRIGCFFLMILLRVLVGDLTIIQWAAGKAIVRHSVTSLLPLSSSKELKKWTVFDLFNKASLTVFLNTSSESEQSICSGTDELLMAGNICMQVWLLAELANTAVLFILDGLNL